MAIDFKVKDVIHKIAVKFTPAFLPDAKKPYNLKPVHQPELDLHEIASKAEVYNITTPPKVIEEGLAAGMELMLYLAADGFRLKTPLFNLRIKVPGEYDGSETHVAPEHFPVARLQPSADLRNYLKEKAKVEFDGLDHSEGLIAEARDEASGLVDEVVTIGNLITIHGSGLKIDCDEAHKDQCGVFFVPAADAPIKAEIIAVNEPRTLKVMVPPTLTEGAAYALAIETMSSAKHGSGLLKNPRSLRSDFTLTAQR